MRSLRRNPEKKYGNIRIRCALHRSHRSKLESAVCEIYRNDPRYEILKAEDHVRLSLAAVLYIADFRIRDKATQEIFWAEAKGYAAPRWPTIKKLWKGYGPGRLVIWGGSYARPTLTQEIVPESNASVPRACPRCGHDLKLTLEKEK